MQLEIGALRLRQNQDHALISAADTSLSRFERGARLWQLASGAALTQAPAMGEAVHATAELLRTDAAIHGVQIHAIADHACVAKATVRFARTLLQETQRALREVGRGGAVEVTLRDTGVQLHLIFSHARRSTRSLLA